MKPTVSKIQCEKRSLQGFRPQQLKKEVGVYRKGGGERKVIRSSVLDSGFRDTYSLKSANITFAVGQTGLEFESYRPEI